MMTSVFSSTHHLHRSDSLGNEQTGLTVTGAAPLAIQPGIAPDLGRPQHYTSTAKLARHRRLWLSLLFAALLALLLGGLFFTPIRTSFAKTTSFETCATVLPKDKPKFCNGSDPIQGGCSFDAQTVTEQPILQGNKSVGLAQVRHSPFCNTYWGRGFSFLPGKSMTVFISELGKGDAASFLSTSSEVYSNMVYATIPTVTIGIIVGPTQVVSTTIPGVNLGA